MKWLMSLRSPTDYENGWISLRGVLFSTRNSRVRGNPGWFFAELAWIPAFAGMTEPRQPLPAADYPRMRIFEGERGGATLLSHPAHSRNAGITSCVNRSRDISQASRGIPGTENRQTRCLTFSSLRYRLISSTHVFGSPRIIRPSASRSIVSGPAGRLTTGWGQRKYILSKA